MFLRQIWGSGIWSKSYSSDPYGNLTGKGCHLYLLLAQVLRLLALQHVPNLPMIMSVCFLDWCCCKGGNIWWLRWGEVRIQSGRASKIPTNLSNPKDSNINLDRHHHSFSTGPEHAPHDRVLLGECSHCKKRSLWNHLTLKSDQLGYKTKYFLYPLRLTFCSVFATLNPKFLQLYHILLHFLNANKVLMFGHVKNQSP